MTENDRFAWGPVLIGALVCLLIQIACVLVGGGLGLSLFELEKGEGLGTAPALGGAAFLAISVFGSFFLGSFLASRWPSRMGSAFFNGVAVWSVATALMIFLVGKSIGASMGSLVANAGVGAGAVGGADAVIRQLNNLRIVSDIQLAQGEIVTHLEVPQPKGGTAEVAVKETKKKAKAVEESPKTRTEVEEAASDVRHVTAVASFSAFGALVLSFVASLIGAKVGLRPLEPEPSLRNIPRAA